MGLTDDSFSICSRDKRRRCFCVIVVAIAAISAGGILVASELTVSADEMARIREAESQRIAAIESVQGTVVSLFGSEKEGGGSGVLFDDHGFVLTNHHVVAAIGKQGKAGLSDGQLYDWNLIGTDPAGDIAIIQLQGKEKWPSAVLGDSRKVRVGQWVMAMGNPFVLAEDYSPTVTMGIVSGVQRYQGGGMVYGNCIQVDSAINPGNSGGPLMNMQGEVIGINGRAAFAERGRVNVGVGFAVSIEQIKNFVPDLLATKVAEHGTLDALFGMRNGLVICEAINLDSRAARAGLKLGDRLTAVNDIEIKTANELANMISTMPAGWPVHVEYEHGGKPFEFFIRLSALTYVVPAAPSDLPEHEPQEADELEEDDAEGEPEAKEVEKEGAEGGEKEPEAEGEDKRRKKNGLPPLLPGSILDVDLNQTNALRIVDLWRRGSVVAKADEPHAVEWTARIFDEGNEVGSVTTVVCRDGRFAVTESASRRTVVRLAKGEFRELTNDDPTKLSFEQAMTNPIVLQVAIQAARLSENGWAELGTTELDGGDYVQGQRAYRLKVTGKLRDPLYVWFSLDAVPVLLKVGFDEDGTILRPAIVFDRYEAVETLCLSHRRRLVTGVSAKVRREWIVESVEPVKIPKLLEGDDD